MAHPRLRCALAVLLVILPAPLLARGQGAPVPPIADVQPADNRDAGWLYRGSDIPPDREWVFGELKNGLRYAVRRNGVPPRQVSIRIAVDAGSLNEGESERGYAHFIEHLTFRGSKYLADGEAKRFWQRMGATFGSDTNATTSPTQTIYKIDIPTATVTSLDESMRALSGMLSAPHLTPSEVDAERRTILAEMREGAGPGQRIGDATRDLFFAGQPLGAASPIGSTAALEAATPQSLRAFHQRWYRPEETTIVIVGDGDPASFAALIEKHFGGWRGQGVADPERFGTPDPAAPRARVIVEPGSPVLINLAVLRPWRQQPDTIAYNRQNLLRIVAARIVNRRLESRARAGGSFLSAAIDQQKVARSVDGTFIQIVPIGNDWRAAIRDVRGVIEEAQRRAPTQGEIDREAGEFAAALAADVETEATQAGADLADNLVEAVNIRETVASPQIAQAVFSNMQARLTPATVRAATRELMAGVPMRAVMTVPEAGMGRDAELLDAITRRVPRNAGVVDSRPVSFDRLPALPPAGALVEQGVAPEVSILLGRFANGTTLVLYPHPAETGKVFVTARFGRGRQAMPADRVTPAFAGEAALIASGIGTLGQNELDRLTSARRIGVDFSIDDDAFVLQGQTSQADLADQLKLMALKLHAPNWDPAPVQRIKAAMTLGRDSWRSSPASVLKRELAGAQHAFDPRWTPPSPEDVAALTPASFRAFWEPLLATGPVELSIYGDIKVDAAIVAAAQSFGALPPRAPGTVVSPTAPSVVPSAAPVVRYHTGPDDQAAAAVAWPTDGGMADIRESRRLDVLAQIFTDRLFDKLREGDGASYSPNVSTSWPTAFAGAGSIMATSQVRPKDVDRFLFLTRQIATDLATKPVTPDELRRAVGPMRQLIQRASTGSSFWLSQLQGVSFDRRKAAALRALPGEIGAVTPAILMATARKYLRPERTYTLVVLPEATRGAAAPAGSKR